MDPRIAAELLYESEATLRMVDSALDELQIADDGGLRGGSPAAQPRHASPAARESLWTECDFSAPSDFSVRAYWQIQELLEWVQQSRAALGAADPRESAAPSDDPAEEGLSGLLALVDRLDTLDESGNPERARLHDQLRHQLVRRLDRSERQSALDGCFATVTSLLSETETRLIRLAYLLEGGGSSD